MFAMSSLRIAFVVFALAACRRTPPQAPPVGPLAADQAPPITPQPPSADALVLSPGEGIGPFALGMTRGALRALAPDARELSPRELGLDGITVMFDADAPAGVATSIRVMLADAAGGVRVGTAVLPNAATYEQVVAAVGPCEARVALRGGSTTPCQSGAVKVVQAGPAGAVGLEVAR
jgi:hypothetical protein